MSKNKSEITLEIISALLIFLFVYTAITKLIGRESFMATLGQLPVIGIIANTLSWILPAIELTTAFLLLIPSLRMWGFAGSFFLMLIFTIYIGYMISFTSNLPCSCGGVVSELTWNQHLVFNIFFTALSATGLRFCLRNNFFIAISRHSRTPV